MTSPFRLPFLLILLLFYTSPARLEESGKKHKKSSKEKPAKMTTNTKEPESNLKLVIQNGHWRSVKGIQLSKDDSKLFSYSKDNTIKVWDLKSWKLIHSLEGHSNHIKGIQISKDERKLFSYSDDLTIKIWDLKKGNLIHSLDGRDFAVMEIQLSKDGEKLFSYYGGGSIKIWDVKTGKLLHSLVGEYLGRAYGIQLNQDESKLFSYYSGGSIKIWDVKTGNLISPLEGHTNFVDGIQLSKDESKLFSYSGDKTIKIWDVKTGKLLHSLERHTESVNGIQLSKDESKLFSYSGDKTIKIWEVKTGKLLHSLERHTEAVYGIQLSKDESKLFSYLGDKTIKIWDVKTGKLLHSLERHTESVNGIQLSKDESKLFSYSGDKTVKIWDVKTGKLVHSLERHTGSISGIQLNNDESMLFSYSNDIYETSKDKTVKIWDVKTGKLVHSLERHTGSISGIQLSKDESKLFSYSRDKSIKIWDVKTGTLLYSLEGYTNFVNGIQLNKDESKLFSYTRDNKIDIRDTLTGKLFHSLEGHTDWVIETRISQDESQLFSYSVDNTIKIWDLKSGKWIHSLEGHSDSIKGIQLSKDESKLFSYSGDKTIKIWEVKTGKLLHSLERHTKSVNEIQLNKDESKLFSHSYDKTIKIWDIKSGKLIHSLEGHTEFIKGIQLSKDERTLFSYSRVLPIKIWDINTGTLLHSLWGPEESLDEIQLSLDESLLSSITHDDFVRKNTIQNWDIETGKLLDLWDSFYDGRMEILSVRNPKMILDSYDEYPVLGLKIHLNIGNNKGISYSKDGTINIWNLKDGKLLHSLKAGAFGEGIKLSKDKSMLFSISKLSSLIHNSKGNTIKIWEVNTGKLLQELPHFSSIIEDYSIQELPNNQKLLISFSSDSSIRYWDIDTGKFLLTQLLFNEGKSICYTPQGYFDFQGNSALSMISFQAAEVQSGFVDLQDLMKEFYVENLLNLILRGDFKPEKRDLSKGINTLPYIEPLFDTQKKIFSSSETTNLSFVVTERNGGKLDEAVAFVNGVQFAKQDLTKEENLKLMKGDEVGKREIRLDFELPLTLGNNRIEVKVYNNEKVPQSYPVFEVERYIPKDAVIPKPDLYILAVGIKEYDKGKRLEFADKDAEDVTKYFSKMKGELYANVYEHILTNKQATKKAIQEKFSDIKKKAKPEDVVIIYFSGHGLNAIKTNGKRIYYFVPQDFLWPGDTENPNVAKFQGIDSEYLDEVFTNIKSHKLIFILDSCYSGAILADLALKGDESAFKIMANGTGRFIFASSTGNEQSLGGIQGIQQSLYTFVLLNALGANPNYPNADSIKKEEDGYIFLSEIRSYLDDQFKKQTQKYNFIQTPPSIFLGRNSMYERVNDFPVFKLKKEIKK